jgi:hypothetical protein
LEYELGRGLTFVIEAESHEKRIWNYAKYLATA